MAFAKLEGTIYQADNGKWTLKVTRSGKFVSATQHDTYDAALAVAQKRKVTI